MPKMIQNKSHYVYDSHTATQVKLMGLKRLILGMMIWVEMKRMWKVRGKRKKIPS